MTHSHKLTCKECPPRQTPTRRLGRMLLTSAGTLCVALGVAGMFLPLLPTTPFLLLAATCYARSSPRFYRWLMTNRWCGEYIRNYREGRGLPLQQKILTLALLWITIGATTVFVVPLWWVRVLLLAIASGVTFHLLRIKTYKPALSDPHTPPVTDALANQPVIEN